MEFRELSPTDHQSHASKCVCVFRSCGQTESKLGRTNICTTFAYINRHGETETDGEKIGRIYLETSVQLTRHV